MGDISTSSNVQQAGPIASRIAAALPDVITAGVFMWVWLDPSDWRRELVAQGMLVMLVEFILIHSSPFLGSAVMAYDLPLSKRLYRLGGMGIFYLLFVGGWAWTFKSWWPVIAFVWLFGAKFVAVLSGRRLDEVGKARQQGLWGMSILWYLLAVFATLFLPMPEFGVTGHGHAYGIPGSGEWVSHPHIVIAAGFFYFFLLGFSKLKGWDYAMGRRAARQGGSLK
jgi:hypothetical protein